MPLIAGSTLSLDRGGGGGGGGGSGGGGSAVAGHASSKQPWQRLTPDSGDAGGGGGVRMQVPVLESSPSLKHQSRMYFHSASPTPAAVGAAEAMAGKSAEDNLSTVSFVSGSTNAAAAAAVSAHPAATPVSNDWQNRKANVLG